MLPSVTVDQLYTTACAFGSFRRCEKWNGMRYVFALVQGWADGMLEFCGFGRFPTSYALG